MNAKEKYCQKIREISDGIVKAQEPIRVLDAIKWDEGIYEKFVNGGCKELPQVNTKYYENRPLGFDPPHVESQFEAILYLIRHHLDSQDPLLELLTITAEQYLLLLQLLQHRGRKAFYEFSKKLYGSPQDHFFEDSNTILSLSQTLSNILCNLDDSEVAPPVKKNLSGEQVVETLRQRFHDSFLKDRVQVMLSDGILADAAAGSSYIKINQAARFSSKQADMLEVHEGWVHVATSLNGQAQSHARWLAKGPPRVIGTQEGLAVLMEVITLRSFPQRVRKINDRIRGIHMAEEGADFLELFHFYQEENYDIEESYRNAMRVCRGGLPTGGVPYTKDIAYCRGFIENYNFLRSAVRWGHVDLVRFFFLGKLHVRDIPLLYQKYQEGVIDRPSLMPPPFEDLSALVVWMSFSNFLNQVDLKRVQEDYQGLFKKYL